MQKILELTSEQFLTGIANTPHGTDGLWFTAKGVNPGFYDWGNATFQKASAGLLRTSPAPTNVTTSDIVYGMIESCSGAGSNIFVHDATPKFYKIEPNNFTKTAIRSTASLSAAVGSIIYNGEYLYNQLTQIGAYNWSTWTDNKYTGLQSYLYHPLQELAGNVYIGDKNRISKLSINSTGTTVLTTNVLDFDSKFVVPCLSSDGRYLVIAINQESATSVRRGDVRILFWDLNSDSWNKEYRLPGDPIISIQEDDISMIAICANAMWRFSYNSKPQFLKPISNVTPPGFYCSAAKYFMGFLYGTGETEMWYRGGNLLNSNDATYCPFTGLDDYPTVILPNSTFFSILCGTHGKKVYKYEVNGTGTTGISPQTISIDLKQKFNIEKITVTFGKALASGDELNIDVSSDINVTATDWGTISYAKHGAVNEQSLSGLFKTNQLSLTLNFNGGTPKIKRITIWGEPDTSY